MSLLKAQAQGFLPWHYSMWTEHPCFNPENKEIEINEWREAWNRRTPSFTSAVSWNSPSPPTVLSRKKSGRAGRGHRPACARSGCGAPATPSPGDSASPAGGTAPPPSGPGLFPRTRQLPAAPRPLNSLRPLPRGRRQSPRAAHLHRARRPPSGGSGMLGKGRGLRLGRGTGTAGVCGGRGAGTGSRAGSGAAPTSIKGQVLLNSAFPSCSPRAPQKKLSHRLR